MAAAAAKYPPWAFVQYESGIDKVESIFKRSASLADVLLCPSEWVAEGVRQTAPREAHKISICPYGSSIDYCGSQNIPIPGRIFYAGGNNPLMKGLLEFVEVTDVLKPKYPQLDFRVAGVTDPVIQRRLDNGHLNLLGKLSWEQMKGEFLTADMFVLATHSEGLAAVVVEALAAGCPPITTRCAGVDITDAVNGMIVAPGDVEGLAAAIERIYRDRSFRRTLAENSLTLAQGYTIDAWKSRLVSILRKL